MIQDDRLLYLLTETQRVLMSHMKDRLFQGNVGLSPAQAGLLFLLTQRDKRTLTEVSRLLYSDNSSISRLVDRMERDQLVFREKEDRDRRTSLVRITDLGRQKARQAEEIVRSVNEEMKGCLDIHELETFKRVLRRLTRTYQKER